MDINEFLQTYEQEMIEIRRELHARAELSTLEYETGRYLTELLERWGISYQYPVAGTGLVATIAGAPGTVVALRADMDALPILEPSLCPYCSRNPGVMHACGHDVHMAVALGVARYFQLKQKQMAGTIKLFFQPAEETIGGAQRMIDEGCMENPHVDYVLGLHMAPGLPTGDIEVKSGKMYAASDEVAITLKGCQSHGAYPDLGVDAIVLAAQLISSLQTIVSRSVSPTDPCVLTLGTIHGGAAHNILADRVELTGALRTTDPATRYRVKELIARHASHVADAFGGEASVRFQPGYDALYNTDSLVELLKKTAAPILQNASRQTPSDPGMPADHIHIKEAPGMGVEDFSFFLNHAPGVFYHLGCASPGFQGGNPKSYPIDPKEIFPDHPASAAREKGIAAPLHSPGFTVDENSIALGIRLQAALTEALL